MQVINSVIFSLLVFYLVKLQGAYTVFWLVYLITSCCGVSALLHLCYIGRIVVDSAYPCPHQGTLDGYALAAAS